MENRVQGIGLGGQTGEVEALALTACLGHAFPETFVGLLSPTGY